MKNPYLVQRGGFKMDAYDNAFTGIDSLVRWDYMGSSEFELGGLNESLKRILLNLNRFVIEETGIQEISGVKLMVLVRDGQQQQVVKHIEGIYRGEIQLKEPSYLRRVLDGEHDSITPCNVWWDIQNDWVAFLGGPKRCDQVMKALRFVRDRKKVELREMARKNSPKKIYKKHVVNEPKIKHRKHLVLKGGLD